MAIIKNGKCTGILQMGGYLIADLIDKSFEMARYIFDRGWQARALTAPSPSLKPSLDAEVVKKALDSCQDAYSVMDGYDM